MAMHISARTIAGLALATLLILGAAGHRQARKAATRVAQLSRRLEGLYGGDEAPSHAALQRSFLALIDQRGGHVALRSLDGADERIAFDEALGTVYFLHQRESEHAPDGPRSCLGWAFEHPEHGRGEGHAGFPGFLELTGVEVEGGAARLRFTASVGGERYGLVAGAAYELRIDPSKSFDVLALLQDARPV